MSLPTKSEVYSRLMEHIRLAQEDAAMLAHLNNADGDAPGMVIAKGWLNVSELFRTLAERVTRLATKGTLQ